MKIQYRVSDIKCGIVFLTLYINDEFVYEYPRSELFYGTMCFPGVKMGDVFEFIKVKDGDPDEQAPPFLTHEEVFGDDTED